MVLHALYENGQIRTQDLETHIRDEIEREASKVAEMTKKVKQAYQDVNSTSPLPLGPIHFADHIDCQPRHRGRHASCR